MLDCSYCNHGARSFEIEDRDKLDCSICIVLIISSVDNVVKSLEKEDRRIFDCSYCNQGARSLEKLERYIPD